MKQLLSLMQTIWRNRRGLPDYPRLLTYTVTFRCNSRCVMCDSWRKKSQNELTAEEIFSIFRQLPKMDFVRLTGGEPFMRNDLIEIAHAAQDILDPLSLHIATNGYLTDRIIRFCEQRKKNAHLYLLISLDGFGESHNAIRGQRNAWNRAADTINALVNRQKELRLKLTVNQTILNDEGVENYLQLKNYLKALGIHHHNIVIGYESSAIYHKHEEICLESQNSGQFNSFGALSHDRLRRLFGVAQKDLRYHPPITRIAKQYYLDGIKNRLLHQIAHPNPKCVALSSHLRLLPDGSLPTCQFNTTPVGNLRHQKFVDVWHGRSITEQRNWVNRCQGCWAECEILPNALYSGDIASLFNKRHGATEQSERSVSTTPLALKRIRSDYARPR